MPSLLRRSLTLLRAPANELTFAVRSRVRWRRGAPAPANEPKDALFPWLDGAERARADRRAAELVRRFDLDELRGASSRAVFAENLALLDRLEALSPGFEPSASGGALRALDVGCGAFGYATALQRWLSRHGEGGPRDVRLRGVEIDGYGIYRDGRSRADHAAAHAALAGTGVTFEVADFTAMAVSPQDVVTLFFPFLDAFSLLAWGSPLSHLRPRRCLDAAVRALRPGGALVVANQTDAEFERLRHLFADRPVTLVRQTSFATDLVPWHERTGRRVGSLWRRNGLPEDGVSR